MLPIILKIRLTTMAMAGWTAGVSPMPLPTDAVATLVAGTNATPVEVKLYDENDKQKGTVAIWRDGQTDESTEVELMRLFRCRRTHREAVMARVTLGMLADVADRYPDKTVEFISAYRVGRDESRTSPHRHATALDFRIRGVALRDIRDYVWRAYRLVGVGWYPKGQYIHIDTRPDKGDMTWTFVKGKNRYWPTWAIAARKPEKMVKPTRETGT